MTDLEQLFFVVEGQALEDRRRIAVLALIDEEVVQCLVKPSEDAG